MVYQILYHRNHEIIQRPSVYQLDDKHFTGIDPIGLGLPCDSGWSNLIMKFYMQWIRMMIRLMDPMME